MHNMFSNSAILTVKESVVYQYKWICGGWRYSTAVTVTEHTALLTTCLINDRVPNYTLIPITRDEDNPRAAKA